MRHWIAAVLLALAPLAWADDPSFEITIREHAFVPSEVVVPAGKKIRLVVKNEDGTAEQFESERLNREKVVPGRSQAFVFVGPLAPGEYPFFGEYHPATATGKLVAK